MQPTQAYIIDATRSAVTKAHKGASATYARRLLSALIQQIIDQHTIDPMLIDDVIVGCAVPEAEQGMNVARLSALLAGLPNRAGGLTVNRLCASGLEAIAIAAAKIQTGQAQVILAGGVESMSMLPFGGHHIRPNPRCFSNSPHLLTQWARPRKRLLSSGKSIGNSKMRLH